MPGWDLRGDVEEVGGDGWAIGWGLEGDGDPEVGWSCSLLMSRGAFAPGTIAFFRSSAILSL